jgi:hypothetical protein
MNEARWFGGFRVGSGHALLLASALVAASSCLNRPAEPIEPITSNRFVDQLRRPIDKIDLLFVIDNSVSMADKQQLLKTAVPHLLRRTLSPPCVDPLSGAEQQALDSTSPCPNGWNRLYPLIDDVHIGVISSSLGTNGGGTCTRPDFPDSDRAHLLPTVRGSAPSWNGSGFLAWDPRSRMEPPGQSNLESLIADFSATIDSVDDVGCGYEATLEAWYRFLVDPAPPLEVVKEGSVTVARGLDEELLRQRAAFLRPDSLLGIVMLTDEDDCSIRDDGNAWLMTTEGTARPRPTSACAGDPESPCCRPCSPPEAAPPEGCTAIAADPACADPLYPTGQTPEDHRNLRCVEQKRRYGTEFLHPTSRYVSGLRDPLIADRSGALVENPVFRGAGGLPLRDPGLVFLAGILGVPWQDVATTESQTGAGLQYLGFEELQAQGRFELILGNAPSDPLMLVSSEPRSGTHPLLGVPLAPMTSQNPLENPINGHEYVNLDNSDLQYACIFPLEEPLPCPDGTNCDCSPDDEDRNRPLCQPPTGGPAQATQYFAKAYPGKRHLEVLHGLGESGVIASICPKVATGDSTVPSYGYNPALDYLGGEIVKRLGKCLPRPLDVELDGSLPCKVAESSPTATGCDCSAPGRAAPSAALAEAVRDELELAGHCGANADKSCADFCVCEIEQTTGEAQQSCQQDLQFSGAEPGYCYVDPDNALGNPELVQNCPSTSRQTLRFVGQDTPRNGAVTFMACSGAPLRPAAE